MLGIRPFESTDADYEALIAIDSAVFPEHPLSVDEWRHQDSARSPDKLFHRDMIERDGEVIAFGEYRQGSNPQKYFFHVFVHPDYEHPDIRPAYLEHVMAVLAERDPVAIISGALDDHTPDVQFLEANGFRPVRREPSSDLDVAAFDSARFDHILEKMRSAHIEIMSLRELQDQDPNWKRKLYELYETLEQDVPSVDAPVERSFEEFEQLLLSGPTYDPDGWFVALHRGQYVGMSRCRQNQVDSKRLDSGLTGVIRSHRRQGIATALKLHVLEYARQSGITTIVTFNDDGNPMYHLNLALGFKPKPAWVVYEKVLFTT